MDTGSTHSFIAGDTTRRLYLDITPQSGLGVGDWVWLRLQHCTATAITDKTTAKLAPQYYGPFQVSQRVGPMAYCLTLPQNASIHDA